MVGLYCGALLSLSAILPTVREETWYFLIWNFSSATQWRLSAFAFPTHQMA